MTLRKALVLALLTFGAWQTISGLYIPAKAWLAQKLIHRAWVQSKLNADPIKPWPWADMSPVARLVAPEHNEELIVLSGASGEALAFGPGHVLASDAPGSNGHVVIGGHRDTHFNFLRNVTTGERLQLQAKDGQTYSYEVESVAIADVNRDPLILAQSESLLTLVTCYPFDGFTADRHKRFVVTARRIRS